METTELKKTKIAGKSSLKFTDDLSLPVDEAENHLVALRRAEGINHSNEGSDFMDGARVINISYNDLINYNGTHRGYAIMENDESNVVSQWEGTVKTDVSNEGKPVITFKGTMEWIKATGKLKNMKGKFSYDGYFTSESEYVVEWEGEYHSL